MAFDGDGDRVIMIDHLGHEIDGDQIIYIIAKEYLKNRMLNGGVVGTLMTNMGVVLSLKKLGIPFFAAPIGDSNVYRKIQEKNGYSEQKNQVMLYYQINILQVMVS